jgi:lipopolysaccharide/colanic/teichoic acid biosynthesis glycosyltransferase
MNRAFDVAVALAGAVMTSPIVAVAAIAVRLDSPGPALYSGPRVGRGGRVFGMRKLRTMRVGADAAGPAVTAAGDARVTRVGRVLRRTKIDELPQLWNIVAGDMSLVGPRPEHPRYVERYTPDHRRLLSVRPGLTGPATVAFIDEERLLAGGDGERRYLEDVMPRKLALELAYLDRASFASDLGVLLSTAALVAARPLLAGPVRRRTRGRRR